jgi:hypothetical protein
MKILSKPLYFQGFRREGETIFALGCAGRIFFEISENFVVCLVFTDGK